MSRYRVCVVRQRVDVVDVDADSEEAAELAFWNSENCTKVDSYYRSADVDVVLMPSGVTK